MEILEQYGTKINLPIKVAVDGTTVYGSSGTGNALATQVDFSTYVVAGNVIKVLNNYGLGFVQTVDSATKLTLTNSDLVDSPSYSDGTVSVNNGSTTVTGSGTSFLDLSAGDLIEIDSVSAVEIASITSDTELVLTSSWAAANKSGVTYKAYNVESFTISRTRTPSLGLILNHDRALDYNQLINYNWTRIETAILTKSGNYIPIQANESIAVDDCLHIIGKSGNYYVVEKALCTSTAKLPCAGFSVTVLSLNDKGYMNIGSWMTGVGTTSYAYVQLCVGDDSKPTWLGQSNYPSSGEYRNVFGEGRGSGTIQFRFNPIYDMLP